MLAEDVLEVAARILVCFGFQKQDEAHQEEQIGLVDGHPWSCSGIFCSFWRDRSMLVDENLFQKARPSCY